MRKKVSSWVSLLYNGTNFIMGPDPHDLSSNPNYFLKALISAIITVRVRASTYRFGGRQKHCL